MNENFKNPIYKGIVECILFSTNYTLTNISDVCDIPLKEMQSIHSGQSAPQTRQAELSLLKLFQIFLEWRPKNE